jgi:AmpD protein
MSLSSPDLAYAFDAEGWCRGATILPSPNFDARPDGVAVDLLVIHNISLPAGRFGTPYVADLFCNLLDVDADPSFAELRDLRVSSHFLIARDGALTQFVSTGCRAWHAGSSIYAGRERCNDFSVGIELEGTDDIAFTDAQYDVLSRLTAALLDVLPLADVAGHQHIAPGRKTDPGPHFNWSRYRELLAQHCALHRAQGVAPQPLRFPATA